jgi:hypothetical protein
MREAGNDPSEQAESSEAGKFRERKGILQKFDIWSTFRPLTFPSVPPFLPFFNLNR